MIALRALTWSLSSLGSAMAELARASGLRPADGQLPHFPERITGERPEDQRDRLLSEAGACLNLEVEHVFVPYGQAYDLVTRTYPALLAIEVDGRQRYLAVLGRRGRKIKVLTPALSFCWLDAAQVTQAYLDPLDRMHVDPVNQMLAATGVPEKRRDKARRALLRERLADRYISGCWLLRLSPGRSFTHQLSREGTLTRLGLLVGAYGLQYVLVLLGWWLVGRGALQGVVDVGWLWAWALLLYSEIPLRVFAYYAQGIISVETGACLKKRLLLGSLKLDPEDIRHLGAGQLLSRVLESETIESAALTGAFKIVLFFVELVMAIWVLSHGAGATTMLLLLGGWLMVSLLLCRYHYVSRRDWADHRLEMTHELIEKMVGHRTRLAQQQRATWHQGEDRSLRDYLRILRRMDRSNIWIEAIVTRGWLVLGMLGLGIGFAAGDVSRAALAVSLGGMLLARNAFTNLSESMANLAVAGIAWTRIATLFSAAGRDEVYTPSLALPEAPSSGEALVESYNLAFHYTRRRDPILKQCNLVIRNGDRLLLQGSSGAGKSTLGSLLTGIRRPDSGLLLFRGLDLDSVGDFSWRKHIVAAPQFHENHVFTETFMFNLLMGRSWPPGAGDYKLAENMCIELGLGPLLERMPAGLNQMVGETGWQLSHGERSRLFIARTLLQGADLVILDESFAALDPENLRICMDAVRKYAPSLLVIAHP